MSTSEAKTSSDSSLVAVIEDVAARLRSPDDGDRIPDETLRMLFTAVVGEYAARSETRPGLPAVEPGVTATEVTACCLALLRAADMQVFELGFWSTHFGIRATDEGAGVGRDGEDGADVGP